MELIFLWIGKEYRKIFDRQMAVFSTKFDVNYSESKLTIKRKNCINVYDQYTSISELTAIVGDNGAGKTSLLRYIINVISNDAISVDFEIEKCMIGFYCPDKNEITVYKKNEGIRIDCDCGCGVKINVIDFNGDLYKYLKNLNVLYLSNSVDCECKDSDNLFININARNFIETSNIYFRKKINMTRPINSNRRIFDALLRGNDVIKLEDFLYIKYFADISEKNLAFCGKTYDKVELVVTPFYYKNLDTDKMSIDIGEIKSHKISDCYVIDILIKNLLFEILSNTKSRDIEIVKNRIRYFEKVNDMFFLEYLKYTIYNFMETSVFSRQYSEYIIESIEFIKAFAEKYTSEMESEKYNMGSFEQEEVLTINVNTLYNLLKDNNNNLKLFPAKYFKILNFNFSSGERALLNFFAWINSINLITDDATFKINENYILIIDEIDLYAHPLWQRQLLSLLLEQLNNEYKDKHIQLIITTHSPIILSDVPKSNTIYIKKTENDSKILDKENIHETFAANIYDLYKNAFYLDNSYVGDLAKKFKDKIFEDLNSAEYYRDETLLRRIEIIGEPILKYKLKQAYEGKLTGND